MLYRVELFFEAVADAEAINTAELIFDRTKLMLKGFSPVEMGDVDAMKAGPPEYDRCIVRRGKPVDPATMIPI